MRNEAVAYLMDQFEEGSNGQVVVFSTGDSAVYARFNPHARELIELLPDDPWEGNNHRGCLCTSIEDQGAQKFRDKYFNVTTDDLEYSRDRSHP